jgi:Tfp pilus assembly protein PilF
MPATTYMVVDPRRDHSLRVPRPDLSVTLGVPNPCNGCHADRSATWAAQTVAAWYGHVPSGFQQFADALSAGARDAPGAEGQLTALVADTRQPAIARASAIALIGARLSPATLPAVEHALGDASPLVRAAAVRALAQIDPAARATMLWRSLDDPVRAVRVAAASAMTGAIDAASPTVRAAFERARTELVATYELAGDRPESHVSLATLYADEHDLDRAETELRRALAIDPSFVPASVNLAELYRVRGREDDAETTLRQAIARVPGASALRYALGLVLVRRQRMPEALAELSAAAHDGTDDAQRGYVYAVALHDTGDTRGARRELERVLEHHPYDRSSLVALVTYLRDAGDLRAALRFAEQLETLEPADATVRATAAELRGRLPR